MTDRLTFKVQTYEHDLGWVMSTRAGDTPEEAKQMLACYDRNWPSESHRLVKLNPAGTAWEPYD